MLTMNHGEDERLVMAAWSKENELPEDVIITSIFGALPRPEFCSRESLLAALPGIKSFHEQLGEGPGEWLKLCLAADIDYHAIEAVRPVSGEVYNQ